MKTFKQILNETKGKALDSKGKELKVGDEVKISSSANTDFAGRKGKIYKIIRHTSAFDDMSVKVEILDGGAGKGHKQPDNIPAKHTTKV